MLRLSGESHIEWCLRHGYTMTPVTEILLLLWLFFVVAIALLSAFRTLKKRRHSVKLVQKFPGPRYTLPILGDILILLGDPNTLLQRGLHLYLQYAPQMRFWLCHKPVVVLHDPDDLEIIMSNHKGSVKPYSIYRLVECFFGRGLLTLNGDEWRMHRKAITPSFHFSVLERYADIFMERSQFLAQRMVQLSNGPAFDLLPLVAATSNETICETAFGWRACGDGKAERDAFIEDMESAFRIMQYRVLHPWFMIDALFDLTDMAKKHHIAEKKIKEYATSAIRMRKLALATAKPMSEEDEVGARQRYSFLDLMLTSDNGLTETDIVGEVRTLIAVQETSSTTLCFALLMLAMHQDVQKQVVDEIEDVWSRPGLTSLQRLHALQLQGRVLKETLRLFPPVPMLGREATTDIKLSNGKVIPKGSLIALFVYACHRDAKVYPEPEKFDPDRFLPEQCAGRHPYTYVPFSAGSRNCVGQKYGMLQMKAALTHIVRRFRIIPPEGAPTKVSDLLLTVDTFLKLVGGTRVRIEERKLTVAGA